MNQFGMMLDTTILYNLNDLDVHSRSQAYRESRICAVIWIV